PARDEAATLERCLASVEEAAQMVGRPTTVVLVLDACTDASAEIAAAFTDVQVTVTDFANVGRARSWGVSQARMREDAHPDAVWIATTDADSIVPRGWLVEHLRAALDGAHAFVGAVVPVLEELDVERRRAWMRTHPPGATVGHVHGANLGLRLSAYTAIGGFTALATGEDVDIVGR
ncbi:glycosyltransferase, partial [Paenibacillus sp. TAF58]